jgi:ABC-2 type transport system permease protein|tara:strand:- start:353 stop:1150 length:798 start_codon:yes stop_codon:yes gene_type:complete
MLHNVYLKSLRDSKKSIIYYSIGTIALGLYVTLFYPTIRDSTGLTDFLEQLPEAMLAFIGDADTYTTPEGFLNAEVFGFMGPMIFGVFAIIAGAGTIAGEEESHSLDQLLANPVSRKQVLLQKAGALLTGLFALSIALWIGIIGGSKIAGFGLSLIGTTQAIFSLYVLGITLGLVALAIGASTGKKSLAGGFAASVAIIGFLLDTFLSVVDALDPLRFISVFYYFNGNDVIINGINPVHCIAMVCTAAIALVIAIWQFEKRDLAN